MHSTGSAWSDRPLRAQPASTTSQCQHDLHTYAAVCTMQRTMEDTSVLGSRPAGATWIKMESDGSGRWSKSCCTTGTMNSVKTTITTCCSNVASADAYHHPIKRCPSYTGSYCENAVRNSPSLQTSAACRTDRSKEYSSTVVDWSLPAYILNLEEAARTIQEVKQTGSQSTSRDLGP